MHVQILPEYRALFGQVPITEVMSRFGHIIARLKALIEVTQAAILALEEADRELQAMVDGMKRIQQNPTTAKYVADSALAFVNEGALEAPTPAVKSPSQVCPRCGVKGLKGCFRSDCIFNVKPDVGKAQ